MNRRFMRTCLLFLSVIVAALAEDFVLIKGGTLSPGVQLDDFEILDHPVTNTEYKIFVDETGDQAPLHWQNGQIPSGPAFLSRARSASSADRR